MIIAFSVENYRSIKARMTLHLEASTSKSKPDNVIKAEVKQRQAMGQVRLLKSAVIYGPNASGKSALIKAMSVLSGLVQDSSDYKIGQRLEAYEPFLLDTDTQHQPTKLELVFLLNQVKYQYNIAFTQQAIVAEQLSYYPAGKVAQLYERLPMVPEQPDYTEVKLGKSIEDRGIPSKVFHQQLYLSQFGQHIPHDQLTPVYKYLTQIQVWSFLEESDIHRLCRKIALDIADGNNEPLRKQLSQLINVADTRIEEVRARKLDDDAFKFPDGIPAELRDFIVEHESTRTVAIHKVYKKGTVSQDIEFDLLKQESQGTKVLFALGGIVLKILEEGGVLCFDELDNSLHPDLCQFIVRLFHEPATNPKGAQLVFTTHDVTLLNSAHLRKDQVWFTQKDQFGTTDLYPLSKIEDVRADTNFEAWYRSGKFKAKPKIKQLKFIREQIKSRQAQHG